MKKWIFVLLLASGVQAGGLTELELELVADGLSLPLAARHAGDGSGRLFIVQQRGLIRVVDNQGNLLATPLLDLTGQLGAGGERGLLGLDFHPNFATNGFFYVNYTDTSGDTVVRRFTISGDDANVADPDSGLVLIRILQEQSNHNGGDVHFGPDGFLYIGMGDGGGSGDPRNRSQDVSVLLGKMLRIDVDNPGANVDLGDACGDDSGGPVNYGIPADNPFLGDDGTCAETWALGLRNPFRFSFDRTNGDMFIGDVGQGAWEEVSFQPAGVGGRNYGWDCREGAHNFNNSAPECGSFNPPVLVEPILEYFHDMGRRSITGGYRYRGNYAQAAGLYFYADFASGEIFYGTETVPGEWSATVLPAPYLDQDDNPVTLSPSAFGEDEAGNLYVADLLGGRVFRFGGAFNVPDGLVFADGFE